MEQERDALALRGRALYLQGRCSEAVRDFERAVALGADSAEIHTLHGLALAGAERKDAAVESYGRALALSPTYSFALINRAILYREARRAEDALADYERALEAQPENFEAHCGRATVLLDQHRYAEALDDGTRAAALRPERPEGHLRRALALAGLDRHGEALESYDLALARAPGMAEAYAGRAAVLQHLRHHSAALADADRAVALAPGAAAAHFNRGAALRDLGRIEQAIQSFERARSMQPDDATTHCNLGGLLLLLGRFEEGWPYFEWRSRLPEAPKSRRHPQPAWDGTQDVSGKILFVYADQGLGDTIQFARFAKLAQQRGARVVMSVQRSLCRLMSTLNPAVEVLGHDESPPAFDHHCALASLPGAFKTTLQNIPADVPYLSAQPERVTAWRRRLSGPGFKIGVSWQGSTIKTGVGRSFPLQALRNLAAIPGVRLISMQQSTGVEQLHSLPDGMQVETLGDDFDAGPDAFVDTAAVMECLDLVISCDTSIAHLAGALGRPTWVMLKRVPDWRWLLDRTDSPWYPTVEVFRQTVDGRWDDVFECAGRKLRDRLPGVGNAAAAVAGGPA
jgi:tetratricopeptide (TPR) repeat protein